MTETEKPNQNNPNIDKFIDGQMLQKVRTHKRLSQQELADLSGVGIATIKRIEKARGPYKCRSTSAFRIAKALQIELDDLNDDCFEGIINFDDIEVHIFRETTPEEVRLQSEKIIKLVAVRHRILSRNK